MTAKVATIRLENSRYSSRTRAASKLGQLSRCGGECPAQAFRWLQAVWCDEQIAPSIARAADRISSRAALDCPGRALLLGVKTVRRFGPDRDATHTTAADINGGRLEVRLAAEQAYGDEAQTVWAMIAQTLALKP